MADVNQNQTEERVSIDVSHVLFGVLLVWRELNTVGQLDGQGQSGDDAGHGGMGDTAATGVLHSLYEGVMMTL